MSTRFFLLLERQQKLDALLRIARDPLEVARLRRLQRNLRERLTRLMQSRTLRVA